MKFKGTIEIEQPLEKVAALFANPAYLGEYQDGFIRKVHLSGEEGKSGAISKMYYKMGKGEMELTETIVTNKLPHYFEGHYHHKHMDNTLITTFTEIDEHHTRYTINGEYIAFRGFIPKMMAFFFPKMFEKQAQKWMANFKAFAEKQ